MYSRQIEALPAMPCRDVPCRDVRPEERTHWPRRIASLLRRVPKARTGYHEPLFADPYAVEDDYYRFRHQPRG